jgi:hypothetical protein
LSCYGRKSLPGDFAKANGNGRKYRGLSFVEHLGNAVRRFGPGLFIKLYEAHGD